MSSTRSALWDKPPLCPNIRVGGKTRDKSAIRKDWRTERRSPYNCQRDALPAFERLMGDLDARWALVSYSSDGNMPLHEMLTLMARRGDLRVLFERYKRYRVSTPRMSKRSHNVELVAMIDLDGPPSVGRVEAIVDEVDRQEAAVHTLPS